MKQEKNFDFQIDPELNVAITLATKKLVRLIYAMEKSRKPYLAAA